MYKKYLTLGSMAALLILTGASCISFGGTAAGPMGVFRTVDKGETWQAAVAYPSVQGNQNISGTKVYRFFDDPSDSNAIYLGTRGQGLLYTYDNADTWRTVPQMAGKFIYGLAVDPKDKCTIYVSDGPHIFKSADCLRTWSIVYTEERPDQRMSSLTMSEDGAIYAALVGGDVMKSTDAGRSWRVVKRFGFNIQQLSSDQFNSKRVYAASYRNGLFRSDDGGENWVDVSVGLDSFSEGKTFYRLVMNPGQKDSLFWISKYGILRTDDAGGAWHEMKLITPPGSVNIYGFAINPNNQKEIYYTGTILGDKNVHVRSTFYKTTDGGTNWVTKKLPSNTIPTVIRIHPDNEKTLFMGFTTLDPDVRLTL